MNGGAREVVMRASKHTPTSVALRRIVGFPRDVTAEMIQQYRDTTAGE